MAQTNADIVTRDIQQFIDKEVDDLRRKIIRRLLRIGEQCVNTARDNGSYKDQTSNLRSSIGYIILEDGIPLHIGGFKGDGKEGKKTGAAYARQVAKEYSEGLVLIVVAGMNYASYVSDMGYDVLDSSELEGKNEVRKLLYKLFK